MSLSQPSQVSATNRQRPPVTGGIRLAMRDAPLDDRVSYYADAVRVGDHHRAFEESGFFDPRCAGQFRHCR